MKSPHEHESQDQAVSQPANAEQWDQAFASSDASDAFEPCLEKHDFCTVGLGECTMRKGHASWGESHWCNKCGKAF